MPPGLCHTSTWLLDLDIESNMYDVPDPHLLLQRPQTILLVREENFKRMTLMGGNCLPRYTNLIAYSLAATESMFQITLERQASPTASDYTFGVRISWLASYVL